MRMLNNNLGYPRIGTKRELKKACEQYWAGNISKQELASAGLSIQKSNWELQLNAGIDLIPCNDFSFYDQVLDMSFLLGVIPARYTPVVTEVKENAEIDLYFAMARGYQKDGLDIPAMEMTKWFDTNYHYIVPEFSPEQEFKIFSNKVFHECSAAKHFLGKAPKVVLVGPVTYLLLGKEKLKQENDITFHRINLIKKLVPVYVQIIKKLEDEYGALWIQLDEPFLAMDLSEKEKKAFEYAYNTIRDKCPNIKIMLTTYFEGLRDNTSLALSLPVCALHIDLVRAPYQLEEILSQMPAKLSLSLGVVDGRNIWKNDYAASLQHI